MDKIRILKSRIKDIISRSKITEDPIHAENTLKWLLFFEPDADDALQISAIGHDIERAMEHIKVRREDYPDYDSFKSAHAKNSARVLTEIMNEMGLGKDIIDDVNYLVSHHEVGGDKRADLLRDVDSLSFFDVNLPHFYHREGFHNALQRCIYGYKRISPARRKWIQGLFYEDDELNNLVRKILSSPLI